MAALFPMPQGLCICCCFWFRALIRLYQRRAFVGWYSHVLHLQQQRFKLQSAVQLLMYGSLARTFRAWLSHTRDMVLKRMVFVQKQHAIQEALRIGDQIRARRNTEMLGATFGAWRFQVRRWDMPARQCRGWFSMNQHVKK